ncbi:helix-turn-helix transcriptional regulator [Pseudobutyrivibrio xylanivorans]|uniref:DNA-binding transcriptional regulator, XRE-family HTH domain n=1 Tax=Pseudobutyrivibrio xylanivorans TaxID=185007 RepID=A0A1G5RS61_PSEXY|nr:helix-turn-helix transcriptional regulator [Pseudobutyrivibrio xylanivorans]SCZ76261.1 DNA-binding transcriptional regulator, XRE-family HTH domain [Pseudobutyrivibrio xylanivorans]
MNTNEKIKEIRKVSGMTQEELADKLGVSRQTISKWEKGLSTPDLEMAISFCELFQISLDEFIREEQMEQKLSLEDIMKINKRNQRQTILLISSIVFILVGLLAMLFILGLRAATVSIEYMLYRGLATGQYTSHTLDFSSVFIPAVLLVIVGGILILIGMSDRFRELRFKKLGIVGCICTVGVAAALLIFSYNKENFYNENIYNDNNYGYGEVIEKLSDDDAYAYLEMDYPEDVFLTSSWVYEDTTDSCAGMKCNVYYYYDGEVKSLGCIESNGTGYPISFSKDGLFAGGNDGIRKYIIKEGALVELSEDDFDYKEYEKSQTVLFAYGAADCSNILMNF